jgi:hypothetical protein
MYTIYVLYESSFAQQQSITACSKRSLGIFWHVALPGDSWRNLSISMLTQEGVWSQKRSCLIKYATPSVCDT